METLEDRLTYLTVNEDDPLKQSRPTGMVGDAKPEDKLPSPGTQTTDAIAAVAVTNDVDSALLSALRDSRERLGLLKLEQVLIDFCNDPQMLQMDIGGPMNGSVVRSNLQESNPSIPAEALLSNPISSHNYPIPSSSNQITMLPKPATAFQRCLLHRLADQFAISCQPQDNGYIRIFKTLSTQIPSVLLIHLKPSECYPTMTTTTTKTTTAASQGGGGVVEEKNMMARDTRPTNSMTLHREVHRPPLKFRFWSTPSALLSW
jgi:hypothetical protein